MCFERTSRVLCNLALFCILSCPSTLSAPKGSSESRRREADASITESLDTDTSAFFNTQCGCTDHAKRVIHGGVCADDFVKPLFLQGVEYPPDFRSSEEVDVEDGEVTELRQEESKDLELPTIIGDIAGAAESTNEGGKEEQSHPSQAEIARHKYEFVARPICVESGETYRRIFFARQMRGGGRSKRALEWPLEQEAYAARAWKYREGNVAIAMEVDKPGDRFLYGIRKADGAFQSDSGLPCLRKSWGRHLSAFSPHLDLHCLYEEEERGPPSMRQLSGIKIDKRVGMDPCNFLARKGQLATLEPPVEAHEFLGAKTYPAGNWNRVWFKVRSARFQQGASESSDLLPSNPLCRTGVVGRGVLPRWGPNFEVWMVPSRRNPKTEGLEVRGGEWGEKVAVRMGSSGSRVSLPRLEVGDVLDVLHTYEALVLLFLSHFLLIRSDRPVALLRILKSSLKGESDFVKAFKEEKEKMQKHRGHIRHSVLPADTREDLLEDPPSHTEAPNLHADPHVPFDSLHLDPARADEYLAKWLLPENSKTDSAKKTGTSADELADPPSKSKASEHPLKKATHSEDTENRKKVEARPDSPQSTATQNTTQTPNKRDIKEALQDSDLGPETPKEEDDVPKSVPDKREPPPTSEKHSSSDPEADEVPDADAEVDEEEQGRYVTASQFPSNEDEEDDSPMTSDSSSGGGPDSFLSFLQTGATVSPPPPPPPTVPMKEIHDEDVLIRLAVREFNHLPVLPSLKGTSLWLPDPQTYRDVPVQDDTEEEELSEGSESAFAQGEGHSDSPKVSFRFHLPDLQVTKTLLFRIFGKFFLTMDPQEEGEGRGKSFNNIRVVKLNRDDAENRLSRFRLAFGGALDDPRNTNNAWMEAIAVHMVTANIPKEAPQVWLPPGEMPEGDDGKKDAEEEVERPSSSSSSSAFLGAETQTDAAEDKTDKPSPAPGQKGKGEQAEREDQASAVPDSGTLEDSRSSEKGRSTEEKSKTPPGKPQKESQGPPVVDVFGEMVWVPLAPDHPPRDFFGFDRVTRTAVRRPHAHPFSGLLGPSESFVVRNMWAHLPGSGLISAAEEEALEKFLLQYSTEGPGRFHGGERGIGERSADKGQRKGGTTGESGEEKQATLSRQAAAEGL
uniref:Uncharacterized protein n=1 Tax=Chromera velia CCMP2878 TaxID=1169474 RepID=A0A0G4IAX8_9ALVE|eukprot:Cvel_12688.t1-p1 / transcript=Cvel_12688.t1 / gene=Cvel_12688 / organism=Chromera_velia_CCMP2878 / gene_product=hypothetical protein / transcript_product=hypothetical protein / location=Cvel_scaffold839:37810-42333(-) / protein_length=1128 / sequence_SO=supercontig / SO=protein_coding / is_pseudo=false